MGDDPDRKTARKGLKRDGDYEIFRPMGGYLASYYCIWVAALVSVCNLYF
jgi:hypothetical protein